MSNNRERLEVEVKFLVSDLNAFRQTLLAAGASLARERVFEHNIRFDTADDQLLQRKQLLRLRRDTAATLTFKGQPPGQTTDSEAKVHEELEVTVSDFEETAQIIQRLGFKARQVYQKYRETFHFNEVEVVLDEMPFGDFVELEGEEAAIKEAAVALGLDWRQRITTNYLALMDQLQKQAQLPFQDLTFANFKEVTVSIADIFPERL